METLKISSFRRVCRKKLKKKATICGRPYREYRRYQLPIILVEKFLAWFFLALTPGKMTRFSYLCLVARTVRLAPTFIEAVIYLAHILEPYTKSDLAKIKPILDTPRLPTASAFEAIAKAMAVLEFQHNPLAYNSRFLAYCIYPVIETEHIFSEDVEQEIIASNMDPTRRLKLRNLHWLWGRIEDDSFDPVKVAMIASKIV